MVFVAPENNNQKPECIYTDEKYENQQYFYKKIFKVNKSIGKGKKRNNYYFEFELGENKYIISFENKESIFVYDVILEMGKKIIDIRRKINQNDIEYNEKMEDFIEALKKDREENKIDELYKDTIELYSKKKGFSLLILLFLKIYKKKNLCSVLLEKFKEMNTIPKDNEKNMDRKSYLKEYISEFQTIKSEADKLIDNNNYSTIEFYGIILCYFNFYDYQTFSSIINELFNKKSNDLYEILLIYNAHFKYPINQDLYFINKFIKYSILNKEFSVFEKVLNYIRDIDTFINVIEKNKEEIFHKYIKSDNSQKNDKYIIKLDKNLKLNKTENIEENETENIKGNKTENIEENNSTPFQSKIIQSEEENNSSGKILTINNKQDLMDNNANAQKYHKQNKKENAIIFEIIKNIKSIIDFSKTNKTFLIYFTNNFWQYILYHYNEPKQDNISICFKIREIFIKYHDLVIEVFKGKTKKFTIKNDAINYYERDEFAFLLDQIIRKFINNNKELTNIEKLRYITQYNPYYIEHKYYNKVDTDIFELFDISNIDNDFIEDFKRMNFENIFKENIAEYINKILSKIKDISNFDTIIKLINIDNLEDKNIFLDFLKKKYDNIIKKEIGLLTDGQLKLNKAGKVAAEIAIINYIYEIDNKRFDFIKKRIKKLDKNIIPLIFIEIMKICINIEEKENETLDEEDKDIEQKENQELEKKDKDVDFKEMKEFIFDEFASKLENFNDINLIINLIDCLEGKVENEQKEKEKEKIEQKDKEKEKRREEMINEFLKRLMKNNLFTKEEFFSSNKNLKISLLYNLFEKGKIQKNDEEYYEDITHLLDDIRKEIDGEIKKKKLEEFLNNDKSFIIERLSLINLILEGFNPEEVYLKLKKTIDEINKNIDKLKYIKENIIIYHGEFYQQIIRRIIEIIQYNQNKKINEYKGGKEDKEGKGGKINELISETEKLKETADNVKKVKDFLLFKVIYEMNSGKDDETNFNNAFKQLNNINIGNLIKENTDINKEIINKIKEKLSNNEERAQTFIQNLIEYYDIKDENLIDELTILFKSKKYELDINSIIFFFEYFEKDNKDWNNKVSKEKYLNLSQKDFKEIRNSLKDLKENKIYDYKNIQKYNKFFTCLYDKKEAIDFLFTKTNEDIDILKDRIQPTDRTINIKDINDTQECIKAIIKMKKLEDNFKIFTYIKTMNENTISQFENYSKIYLSVIELDRNDISENVYEQVINIIEDATFNILQDTENFLYYKKEKNKKEKEKKDFENITLEELIHLKNKIQIKNEFDYKIEKDDDKLKSKCKILIFFKNMISNLEIINEYMNVLRTKGSSLPIKITIKVRIQNNVPTIIYYLDKKKNVQFEEIRNFLFNAKTKYISQLDSIYKEKFNLRLLYGKQFRSVMKHLESNLNIDSFLRYILNNTDNNISIKEGYKAIERNVKDYIKEYELYNQNSLDSISTYITSLFKNNNKTLEEHYDKMKIISENIDKGIYLHECEENSKEKFILNLFWDKTIQLPIAQNILITNKETSSEEIQAFFHRAILCNYNTLFIVEINDSFSNYQQSIMNSYIDNLLSYKKGKYDEETKENNDKKKTQDYLDSCIVFVYDKNNKNITSFLNEINKLEIPKFQDDTKYDNNKFLSDLKNIMVIASEICGLGKTEKIKKIIKDNKKKYFHFPLGGILTKNIIFNKLQNLLNKIKNEKNEDIAIHLDLTESKETSIINEFFFSFLITKFYTNNESIIYIPKDIYIYIEIPNCFEDYLSKFSILNIFNKENITRQNKPNFNYPPKIINIFKNMLEIDSNDGIQNFVNKYIQPIKKKEAKIGKGKEENVLEKYSYHQINIFIKLFISQYSKFEDKIYFSKNGKDVTKQSIRAFAQCTQYFTNGGFSKLLTGIDNNNDNKKQDYLDKLSEIYENDLRDMKFPYPLIFTNKEKMIYDELFIPQKDSNEYKNSKDYLKRIKEILNLPNEVEEDKGEVKSLLSIIEEKNNNYVITNDNFKKMVLLLYRIKANVPVIIMGDTGCGKTALITKLNQIINNGKTTVKIINIHPGITDEKLCNIMKEKDELAKQQNDKELWLFFDEMNTCLSLSLLTEIFINRTYNGNSFSDNIRLIGACNPYRKRKEKKEKYGLSISDDNDNELVYLVKPLPQSLLYYVFCFGSINEEDEKKYIYSMIEKLFTKEEQYLHEITTDAISQCHIYLRDTFDPSVVSLREIARFSKCFEFFQNYFTIKNKYEKRNNNKKNNKIRSIICSIYLCYYIRLSFDKKRTNFESILRPILLKLVNNDKNIEEKGGNLMDQISNEDLKNEIATRPEEIINNFSDFIIIEQDYLLSQIELDKGIGKNTLLKENVFLLFLSVNTNIPLIIIGKPGTGKSLSAQLINKSMRGKYSKNKFFQQFPEIIQSYFQG